VVTKVTQGLTDRIWRTASQPRSSQPLVCSQHVAYSPQLSRSDPWINLFRFASSSKLNQSQAQPGALLAHEQQMCGRGVSGQGQLVFTQMISGHIWRSNTGLGLSLIGST